MQSLLFHFRMLVLEQMLAQTLALALMVPVGSGYGGALNVPDGSCCVPEGS